MPKGKWKKCSYCGIITDIDEKNCPMRGLDDNSKHKLRIVNLEVKDVRRLCEERKIWTKDVAELERKFLNKKAY